MNALRFVLPLLLLVPVALTAQVQRITADQNLTGTVAFTADITPAQITANQNDYAPTGHATASIFRLSTDASRNITGLQGGADGRMVVLQNVGSFAIVLVDESASSTEANRFSLIGDYTIPVDGSVQLLYDETADRWRFMGTPTQGTVTSVAMTVPSFLSLAGSPITSSGTLAVTLATQTANTIFAGPDAGGAAAPTFRALVTADFPADGVTYAKLQNISATDRLLGRDSASAGDTEEITVGGGIEFTGSGGIQRSALAGDVTAPAGSNSTTIADDAVTYAKMQNISATDRLLGRDTSGAGNTEELTVGGGIEFTGSGGIQRSALTGDVTASAGSNATTVVSASTSQAGKVELATTAEALSGTSTSLAPSVASMEARVGAASNGRALLDTYVFDGATAAQRGYFALSTAGDGIGAAGGSFSQILRFRVPVTAATKGLAILANDSGAFAFTGNAMMTYLHSTDKFRVDLSDNISTNRRYIETAAGSINAVYGGQWITAVVVYDGTTTKPTLYINGASVATTEVTAGTAPAWNAGFNDDYYYFGGAQGGQIFNGEMAPPILINGVLTAAEVLAQYQSGRFPLWCETGTGSMATQYTSDFSAGVNGWAVTHAGAIAGNIDSIGGQNDNLRFTSNGGNVGNGVTWQASIVIGRKYRVSFDAYCAAANTSKTIRLTDGSTQSAFSGVSDTVLVGDTWTAVSVEGEFANINIALRLMNSANNDLLYVRNVTVRPIGPIVKPRPNPGSVTIRDGGSNNITGVVASGATVLTHLDRGSFTATLTWSGTHESKSLLGAQALPSNAMVTQITRKATVASSGSGCTIGTTTSATRWQALDTFTTAKEVATLANQLPAGSAANDLDIVVDPDTANYTGSITVTVHYVITDGTP